MNMKSTNDITETIISRAIEIHTKLGPGLLESVYKACLFYELTKVGIPVDKEVPLPLVYNNVKLECGYRIDLLVDKTVVVEIISVDCIADIHLAQTLTYLRLSRNRFGLLLNFNVVRMKDGIKRVVNGY
jgi:GxxExxY protein